MVTVALLTGCSAIVDGQPPYNSREPVLKALVSHYPNTPGTVIVDQPARAALYESLSAASVEHFQIVASRCSVASDGQLVACAKVQTIPSTVNVREAALDLISQFAINRQVGRTYESGVTLSVDLRYEGVRNLEKCIAILLCGVPTPPPPPRSSPDKKL